MQLHDFYYDAIKDQTTYEFRMNIRIQGQPIDCFILDKDYSEEVVNKVKSSLAPK